MEMVYMFDIYTKVEDNSLVVIITTDVEEEFWTALDTLVRIRKEHIFMSSQLDNVEVKYPDIEYKKCVYATTVKAPVEDLEKSFLDSFDSHMKSKEFVH